MVKVTELPSSSPVESRDHVHKSHSIGFHYFSLTAIHFMYFPIFWHNSFFAPPLRPSIMLSSMLTNPWNQKVETKPHYGQSSLHFVLTSTRHRHFFGSNPFAFSGPEDGTYMF